ncbi:MAG: hypothetical protein L0Y76_03095 [Ignavibacteria bacterium]|nr:hypothetical protein [Ignavibacteria bacterium]
MKTHENFPNLISDLCELDEIFRQDFTFEEMQYNMKYCTSARQDYRDEEVVIWNRLFAGEITEAQALLEIYGLMVKYYGDEEFDNYKMDTAIFLRNCNIKPGMSD